MNTVFLSTSLCKKEVLRIIYSEVSPMDHLIFDQNLCSFVFGSDGNGFGMQEVHILSHSHGFYGSRLRLMQQRGLLFFTAIPSK